MVPENYLHGKTCSLFVPSPVKQPFIDYIRGNWVSLRLNMIEKEPYKARRGERYYSRQLRGVIEIIDALPLALPAGIAAFGAVAMALLLGNQLRNVLVWPLGGIAGAAAFLYVVKATKGVTRTPAERKESYVCSLLILGGAILWFLVNAKYSSQDIFINRDPAVYANAGAWLIHHSSLHIPIVGIGTDPLTFKGFGAGFAPDAANPGYLFAQGLHLLPVFLGLAGRIGGEAFALHMNAFFGATALLALYGFAKFIAKPRYALLITSIFAFTLPLIAFSRDTYTEPLAATLTFGALSLMVLAVRLRYKALWFLAGLLTAAGTFTRADAFLSVAALLFFLAVYLIVTSDKKRAIRECVYWIVGGLVGSIIGWLDLTHLSSGYYTGIRPEVHMELYLLIAIVGVGIVAVTTAWQWPSIVQNVDGLTKHWRARALVAGMILVMVVLASRPLWYVAHQHTASQLIADLQAQHHAPVQPMRDYAEQSVNWIWWYIGPLALLFGAAGLVISTRRVFSKRYLYVLPALLVVGTTSLLYLTQPSISPDQIWASRRFVPVILPGVLAFGAIAFELFDTWKIVTKYRRAVWTIAIVMLLAPVIFISYPYLRIRTYTPELSQMQDICRSLPSNASVIWVGRMRLTGVQPTQIFCNVPAIGLHNASQTNLAEAAQAIGQAGRVPIIGTTGEEESLYLGATANLTQVDTITYNEISYTLYRPPRGLLGREQSIVLGKVLPDGSVEPLWAGMSTD